MSELELPSSLGADAEGGGEPKRSNRPRLIDLAETEHWSMPTSLRAPLFARLEEIISDPTAERREILAAASAIIAASRLNLANINLMIKVKKLEELEERMLEIERHIEEDRKRGG